MRKSFFTLVLAIAAGVWTLSNALCLGSIPDAMYQPYTTVSGTIQALPFPCEPGEDCPTCLTEAIVTNDKTYYLTTKNQQVADFLEQIQTSPVPAIYLLPLKATASGTHYQMGSFDYLLISSLNELSVEYFSDHYDPDETPTDTIPLFSYAGDNPGSSTVDPVDPNQVVVTLKGDELTIREISGEEIMMALSLNQGDASVPAFNRVQRTQSFQNELTVTLTEEGLYRLELSNPSWGYNIFGTFDYPQRKDAIDQNVVPTPAAQKIIRNGQLLIRKGEKIYTVQGAEVNE